MFVASVGTVSVATTSGRGWSAEECAGRFVDRLVAVSDTAPPGIREQAQAFKDAIRALAVHHMREAVASERTTLCNKLREAGLPDAAEIIGRL